MNLFALSALLCHVM